MKNKIINADITCKAENSNEELIKALTKILELPNTIGDSFIMQDIAKDAIRKVIGEKAFLKLIGEVIEKW